MAIEKVRWVKVAENIEEISFGANNLRELVADEKRICLGKFESELFAFPIKCPHASGILADGFIDALGNVVCPLHRYRFCMKNGRNVSGEGYYLKHWPVEVREDGVFVGLESKNFFGLF
ncbi:MAG TPA: Rieske 2Fe-2S domain-containing protein [Flavisolibacter sp.]|jgi:3-phenylpropionate/trans-cinnamate dioxygenase ferredoxin subunit|nr:Rieske 2Fe-2S domain-containing protein [Flavisolibacter sp.]